MATKAAPGKRALIIGAPRQGALFRPNSSVGKLSFSLSLPFPTAAELMSKLLRVVALRWSRGIPGGEELRNRNSKLQPGPKKSLPQKFARERGRGESHPDRECKCDAHSPRQRQRERKAQVSQRHRLLGHTGSNSAFHQECLARISKSTFYTPQSWSNLRVSHPLGTTDTQQWDRHRSGPRITVPTPPGLHPAPTSQDQVVSTRRAGTALP